MYHPRGENGGGRGDGHGGQDEGDLSGCWSEMDGSGFRRNGGIKDINAAGGTTGQCKLLTVTKGKWPVFRPETERGRRPGAIVIDEGS